MKYGEINWILAARDIFNFTHSHTHTYFTLSSTFTECILCAWRCPRDSDKNKFTHQLTLAWKTIEKSTPQVIRATLKKGSVCCPLKRCWHSTMTLTVDRQLQIMSVAISVMGCWRWKIWLDWEWWRDSEISGTTYLIHLLGNPRTGRCFVTITMRERVKFTGTGTWVTSPEKVGSRWLTLHTHSHLPRQKRRSCTSEARETSSFSWVPRGCSHPTPVTGRGTGQSGNDFLVKGIWKREANSKPGAWV